jgi:hypothetical protein
MMPAGKLSWRGALATAAWGAACACGAAERLDDSTSPRARVAAQVVLSEAGRPLADTLDATSATVRFGRIDYRLATARYVGKVARIYYVIPAAIQGLRSPAGLRVEWKGYGQLASGAARPGERQLVWSGIVREPSMAVSLDLGYQVDLRQLHLPRSGNLSFESYFEIEASP